MARYDKYDPMVGNFRAPLAADWASGLNTIVGVGLDTSGRVVPGAGNTGIVGIVCLTKARKAGEIVDVMKHGELVETDLAGTSASSFTAGTSYYAATSAGAVSTTATGAYIGHTVEASRMVIDVLNFIDVDT